MVEGKKVDSVERHHDPSGRSDSGEFRPESAARPKAATKQAEMQKAIETGQLTKEHGALPEPEQKAAMEKQIKEQAEQDEEEQGAERRLQRRHGRHDRTSSTMTRSRRSPRLPELDPAQTAVWAQLGEAYVQDWRKARRAPEFDTNIGKAMEAYTKAIELKPDDPAQPQQLRPGARQGQEVPRNAGGAEEGGRSRSAERRQVLLQSRRHPGELRAERRRRRSVQEGHRADPDLRRRLLSVRRHAGRQGEDRCGDGKVTPVPGTIEAFQKYLELAPTGQWAQSAKEMLTTMDMKVDTNFTDPNAKKNTKSTTKKK